MSHVLEYSPELELHELPFEVTTTTKLLDMPKIDLHRHLVGAIRPEVLVYIANKLDITLPTFGNDIERIRKVSVISSPIPDGYKHFLAKRIWAIFQHIFSDRRGVTNAIYWATADAARDNVQYVEFRVSPYGVNYNRGYPLSLHAFVECLQEGIEAAQRDYPKTIARIILSLGRRSVMERWDSSEHSRYYDRLITVANAFREIVVGFDLSGDEDKYPNEWFKEFAVRVKSNGFPLTVHAGETGNPDSIWTAIDLLKADRIGHGIGARYDSELVKELAIRKIPVEICPTSNVMLGLVESFDEHPIREFLSAGMCVTLNTDDPSLLGPTTLSTEFYKLVSAKIIDMADIQKISTCSISACFANSSIKAGLTSETDEFAKNLDEAKVFTR